MKEIITLKKNLEFNSNISEITSISLECNFEELDNAVKGEFLIDGTYKGYELSLNRENFDFKVPFENEIKNHEKDSVNVNIKDFTYEIDADILIINIEYELSYEEVNEYFEDEREFEKFLNDHEVDVVDLTKEENEVEEEKEEDSGPEEKIITTNIIGYDNEDRISDDIKETIFENMEEKEEKYITYHVYVCEEDDTLERVSNKFKVSVDELKDYNNIDEVVFGMKIIIPFEDE